jgi:hypothetical protein
LATDNNIQASPLEIKDCALITIATGRRAQTLKELREHLLNVPPSTIYTHFWGNLLQPRFEEREYNNDFASWVRHGLHDKVLAERLAVIDPTRFPDMEALREELVEIVGDRLDESETMSWASSDQQFEFIRSQVVVFGTERSIAHPAELAAVMEQLSVGSVFYHFIDARRRRQDSQDDFSAWLQQFGAGYDGMRDLLGSVDPYFAPLVDLRSRLAEVLNIHLERERNERPA